MSDAITTYVAIGDSFSAGIPGQTPWPDLVAERLSEASPGLRYGNFAAVGVTSHEVAAAQLAPALARAPDLISVICGANDVILSVRPDELEFARTLAAMFGRIGAEAPGALVVTATYPAISPAWCRPRTRARVHSGIVAFNAAIRRAAHAHGALCLDWQSADEVGAQQNFAADGFHPSDRGHRLAADAFLAAVGHALTPQTTSEVA
jgi:lysophospholipase L1-like esterase